MEVLKVLVLLLVSVERSECVRCFAGFDLENKQCSDEIGEVDMDECCYNRKYGYMEPDGDCQSCGNAVWSSWSSWSQCNVLCGEGVRQRTRKCFGFGECENMEEDLQAEPCASTCCSAKGWDPWQPWSPCPCGVGGVKKRMRVCSTPECPLACSGPAEETEGCPTHTCPVHGGWSSWSTWSQCSSMCIDNQRTDVIIPSRTRFRSCNNPAPSIEPPGDVCPGADFGVEDCTHLPKCPEDGNWGAWSPPGPCTVTCGEGLQLSTRTCNSPPPKYGGRYCDGPSSQTHVCQSPCPVDGLWSDWSVWSQCSSSCHSQTRASTKTRQRFCSSPAPSTTPPGKPCVGEAQQTERCSHLPFCPVDGGWGPWTAFEPCSVTCGVGQRVSVRTCNNPTPQHGGKQCPGDRRQTKICHTDKFCPVDGEWSAWTPWAKCKGDTLITCKNKVVGLQSKERTCLHQDHGGAFCPGAKLADFRLCNDVNNCPLKGTWQNWGEWSLCLPPCGETSQRSRTRFCQPVYTGYRTTYGQQRERVAFVGTPQVDCGPEPDGGIEETMPCLNAPPCTKLA